MTTMTPAEFRIARESLGLAGEDLARLLGIASGRQVRGWEAGTIPIPQRHIDGMRELQAATADEVDHMVTRLSQMENPRLVTYASDQDYVDVEAGIWSAHWHRTTAGKAAAQVPGARLTFNQD